MYIGIEDMSSIFLSLRRREILHTDGAMPLARGAEHITAEPDREVNALWNRQNFVHADEADGDDDVPTCRICHGSDRYVMLCFVLCVYHYMYTCGWRYVI